MTEPRRARVVGPALALTLACALSGCGGGGSTDLSSTAAKASLDKSVEAMRKGLDRPGMGQVVTPWKAETKKVSDPTCADGGARWRAAASLTVNDRSRDGDGAVATLIGALEPTGWDSAVYVGDLDDDPVALVPATYGDGSDAVAADVSIVRATQGWTYVVSARSGCVTK